MPQFSPGAAKTAIAPIKAKPAGMACEAELFLGPDELTKLASSGRVPFVSTGASQNISLPITMPSEGTYHGYIDVFTNGLRFLAYKTVEDVIIKVLVADIRVENLTIEPAEVFVGEKVTISVTVTNYGTAAGEYTVKMVGDFVAEQTITLAPGLSIKWGVEAVPAEARTYQVSVNGLTGSFKAVGVAEFYMPAAMRGKMYPTIDPYTVCEVWVDVTNNGGAAGTQIVHIWDSVGNVDTYKTVTLQPGETKTIFHRTQWIDFSRISSYTVWAQGDWVDNNYSKAIF